MTVKTAVSFTKRHHSYAKRKVEEGVCSSVSGLVGQAIERLIQDEEEREAILSSMATTLRERANAPEEDFVEMDENDTMFQDAKRLIHSPK